MSTLSSQKFIAIPIWTSLWFWRSLLQESKYQYWLFHITCLSKYEGFHFPSVLWHYSWETYLSKGYCHRTTLNKEHRILCYHIKYIIFSTFIPYKELMTDQSKKTTNVQHGRPVSITDIIYWSMGDRLLTKAEMTQICYHKCHPSFIMMDNISWKRGAHHMMRSDLEVWRMSPKGKSSGFCLSQVVRLVWGSSGNSACQWVPLCRS